MFRMEFRQSLDPADDDQSAENHSNDGDQQQSVHEQYRHRTGERSGSQKVFEGRVGRNGKMHRLASTNEAVQSVAHHTPMMSRWLSSNVAVRSKVRTSADLIDYEAPTPKQVGGDGEGQAGMNKEVLREIVKPFADSVSLNTQSDVPRRMDNDIFLKYLDHQPRRDHTTHSVNQGVEAVTMSPHAPATSQSRSDSTRSTSSGWSDSSPQAGALSNAEGKMHLKDEDERSFATRAYNRAFNKLMHKGKSKSSVHDASFTKSWDVPLLAAYEQAKLARKAQKEVKIEAKRVAEEAKRDSERRQQELSDLANSVPTPVLGGYKESDMLSKASKGIHKLFHGRRSKEPRDVVSSDALEAKLVLPRLGLFSTASSTDVAIAQRSAPQPTARKDLQFSTVQSNQRDVAPWTMEEYMAKNGRLTEWNNRADDEEFGAIEGNNLLNLQNLDSDIASDGLSSDSD